MARSREKKGLSLSELKKRILLHKDNEKNDMVTQAINNIKSVRKESLDILEIVADFSKPNETEIKELINKKCVLESWKVRKESSEYLYPLEPNLMCKDVVKSLYESSVGKNRTSPENIFYTSMIVYDSIKKIKLAVKKYYFLIV